MEQQPKAIICAPRCCNQGPTLCVCVKCSTPNKAPKPILRVPNELFPVGKKLLPQTHCFFFSLPSYRTEWRYLMYLGQFANKLAVKELSLLQLHSTAEHSIKSRQHWFFFASGGLQATGYMRVKNHGVKWRDERKASLKVACNTVQPGATWRNVQPSPKGAHSLAPPPPPGVLGGCADLLVGWQFFMPPSSITISPFLPGLACFIDFQDQVGDSSCPCKMMFHSKWGGGGELLYVQPSHSQKGAACTYGGFHMPGVEQVLFML